MEWEESEMSLKDSPEAKKTKLAGETEEATEIEQAACVNRDKTSTYMEAKIGDPSSSRSAVAKERSMLSQYTNESYPYPLPDHMKKILFQLPTMCDFIYRLRTGSKSEVKECLRQVVDDHKQKSPTKEQSERNVGVGYSESTKQFVESGSLRGESSKAEPKLVVSEKSSGFGSKPTSKGTYRPTPNVKRTKTTRNKHSREDEESSKVDFLSVSAQKLSMEISGQDDSESADSDEEKQGIEPKFIKKIFRCLREKFKVFHRQRRITRMELKLIIQIYKYIEELRNSNVNENKSAINHPLDARYSRIPKFIERFNKLRQAEASKQIQLKQTNDVIKAALKKMEFQISGPSVVKERWRVDSPVRGNFAEPYSGTAMHELLTDYFNLMSINNSAVGPRCVGSKSDISLGLTSECLKTDDPKNSQRRDLAYLKIKLCEPFRSTYQKQNILMQHHHNYFKQEYVLNKIYENILELKSLSYMPYTARPVPITSIFEREDNLRREISQFISHFTRLLEQETNEMTVFFNLNKQIEVAVDEFDAPIRRGIESSGLSPIRSHESGTSGDELSDESFKTSDRNRPNINRSLRKR